MHGPSGRAARFAECDQRSDAIDDGLKAAIIRHIKSVFCLYRLEAGLVNAQGVMMLRAAECGSTSDAIDGVEVAVVGLHDGVQSAAGVAKAREQHGGCDAAARSERERRNVSSADA